MKRLPSIIAGLAMSLAVPAGAQTIYEYSQSDARVLFFSKNLSQYIPHMIRMYEEGKALHTGIWNIDTIGKAAIQPPLIMVKDWADTGNGGVTAIPRNLISIEMAPFDYSYFISPAVERYHHLFRHEYTHTVMTDKTAKSDRVWRTLLGGKFTTDARHPFSALWSFMSTPRWYSPRWYHEGIACFMETWLSGGVGRALGGYDEMYFRSIVDSNDKLYSVVGLEAEGSVEDFQLGTNSYLYGTRFVNYLELEYGLDKLLAFYNRTEDSKALFNRQFENVYGKSLRNAWDDWREYEVSHQKQQLETIQEYPVTKTVPLTDKAMGSMSAMVLDEDNGCAYMAVNCPGDFAHIERMDLNTLKRKSLAKVDGPQLYQTSFITLDKKGQRLIWTTQNGKYRGFSVYDLKRGKVQEKHKFQRVSCIVYDNTGNRMYGIMTNEGREFLCRYDSTLAEREVLYSFPFGLSVFDIDVSRDGKFVSATISDDNGGQSLVLFDIDGVEQANMQYEVLLEAPDFNLGQFRFSPDGKSMIGSSYYTGVSNVWSIDLESREMSLLSNVKIGLFSPVKAIDGTMYALEFERNGMRPVKFQPQVLDDANSVEMLGQKAYNAHSSELEALSKSKVQVPKIEFGQVYDSIKVYRPRLKFTGAYPELSGFRDRQAWNKVTPVLGYRFTFQDPLGLNSLKMDIGISPWSHNDRKHQYHAQAEWKYWQWSVKAAWNPTSFYDLVGPGRSSRKGWQTSVSYDKTYSMLSPASYRYGFSVNAYGGIDALPLFQDVETQDVTSFQTASAYYQWRKTRSTLGATTTESGIILGADAYAYLAGGHLYPSLELDCDYGFLVPIMRNTCFWIRSAVGQNFGDRNAIFGNEYFGGFGNNWVDYREANRYRNTTSFAGLQIDEVEAHSFAKVMGELSLRPIHFNDFGTVNLYPTYSQINLFASGLAANPWGGNLTRHANVGVQLNTEMVLFKFLKTTWSVGYAHAFNFDPVSGQNKSGNDWLISLKLL